MVSSGGVDLVGVQEAARIAGRTPETIRRWVWAGRLAARRDGRRLLVERRAVQAAAAGRGTSDETDSLAGWAREVTARRRTGALPAGRSGATAADLVAEDRWGGAG